MVQYRMDRLGNLLREEIATLIMRHEVKDPRVNEFLTINRVEVVKDLYHAGMRIYRMQSIRNINTETTE